MVIRCFGGVLVVLRRCFGDVLVYCWCFGSTLSVF